MLDSLTKIAVGSKKNKVMKAELARYKPEELAIVDVPVGDYTLVSFPGDVLGHGNILLAKGRANPQSKPTWSVTESEADRARRNQVHGMLFSFHGAIAVLADDTRRILWANACISHRPDRTMSEVVVPVNHQSVQVLLDRSAPTSHVLAQRLAEERAAIAAIFPRWKFVNLASNCA